MRSGPKKSGRPFEPVVTHSWLSTGARKSNPSRSPLRAIDRSKKKINVRRGSVDAHPYVCRWTHAVENLFPLTSCRWRKISSRCWRNPSQTTGPGRCTPTKSGPDRGPRKRDVVPKRRAEKPSLAKRNTVKTEGETGRERGRGPTSGARGRSHTTTRFGRCRVRRWTRCCSVATRGSTCNP